MSFKPDFKKFATEAGGNAVNQLAGALLVTVTMAGINKLAEALKPKPKVEEVIEVPVEETVEETPTKKEK